MGLQFTITSKPPSIDPRSTHREERPGLAAHAAGGQHQVGLHAGARPHEGRGGGHGGCGCAWIISPNWVRNGRVALPYVWWVDVPNGGGGGRVLRAGAGPGDGDAGLARRRPGRPEWGDVPADDDENGLVIKMYHGSRSVQLIAIVLSQSSASLTC